MTSSDIIHGKLETFSVGEQGSPAEAKIAKDISKEFIYTKVGRNFKNPMRKETETMIRISEEIETKHDMVFKSMCNRLNVASDTAYKTFTEVADEIFKDDCNWGRIVVLYSFGGKLAQHCQNNNMDQFVDKIVNWVGSYVGRKAQWMKEKGKGWPGFLEQFKDVQADSEKFWYQGIVATTLGLGTIAAALYIKS